MAIPPHYARPARLAVATDAPTAKALRRRPRDLDRYRLMEKLGMGAMGEVFRARDTRLDRDVAVKVFKHSSEGAEAKAEWMEQVKREALTVSALNHPNIVTVHDLVLSNDQAF